MRLSEATDFAKIETVQTGQGCPEDCLYCGSYPGFDFENRQVRELTGEQLRGNLDRRVEETRLCLSDLFADYLTADVNTEPLRGDIFPFFAKLVHELSDGKSKVVCISHGLRAGNMKMKRRLQEIVELMKRGIVPLFVLTVDSARDKGQMTNEETTESYLETFRCLRPLLVCPDVRVTASIQGNDNPESRLSRVRALNMFEKVVKRLQLTPEEGGRLHLDLGRQYVNAGRAKKLLPGVGLDSQASIVPDTGFVGGLRQNHIVRGMVDLAGRILIQPNQVGASYNTAVDPRQWEEVDNGGEELIVQGVDRVAEEIRGAIG